jgi:hypothetical protein
MWGSGSGVDGAKFKVKKSALFPTNCKTQPSEANKQSKQASKQTSKLAWVSIIIA